MIDIQQDNEYEFDQQPSSGIIQQGFVPIAIQHYPWPKY